MTDKLIPQEWTKTCIGNVCSVAIGGTPSRANPAFWDGDKKSSNLWVSIRDLNKKYIDDTAEYISDEGVRKSNVKLAPRGTTLMSFKLTIGRVAVAGRDLYTNEAIAALIPNHLLSNEYLYYGLQSWDLLKGVDQAIKGATLNKAKIKQIAIFFPNSLEEQQWIAKVLSTIDEAIERTEVLIAKLTRVKQGLMQDLITRGIDDHGNVRSEKTHKFKDSPLGRIPEGWDVTDCKSVCREIVVGIVIKPSQYYVEEGIAALRSANVREGYLDPSDLVYISEKSNKKLSKSIIHEGDVLTVRTGYPGSSCVVTRQFDGANCIDVIISRPMKKTNSHFLALWINSPWGKGQILQGQGGLAQQHFNVGALKKVVLVLPSKKEQEAIIEIVAVHDKQLKAERDRNKKLQALRLGLMDDLLAGKVRINNLLNQ